MAERVIGRADVAACGGQRERRGGRWGVGFLFLVLLGLVGCQSSGWKSLRSLLPTARLQGGAEFSVRKSYIGEMMWCGVFSVDNRGGETKLYIDPHKAQFVGTRLDGKKQLGIWAMKRTVAAREDEYREMVREHQKLPKGKSPASWSSAYFPIGEIRVGQEAEGFICFQLAQSPEDPERIILSKRSRVRFAEFLLGGGEAEMGWFWFHPVDGKEKKGGTKKK